ncbi:hypothetical protein M9Y10_013252 [Tritrichomonas musculus]|uniref:Protein kinase domain-containing protein n=1 Tax=Tritrichomonas musculus TaxID=1915356 RepID=A0ABR2I7E5_9EUKA
MENIVIPSDYKIITKLGTGSFATVWEVEDVQNGNRYAMKIIPHTTEEKDMNGEERLKNEVTVCKILHHQNIAELVDFRDDEKNAYLVFELCSNGTLGDLLMRLGQIPEDELRGYFIETAKSLRYLHEEANIIHRDIKIDNIMFNSNNSIKIIDFGLSTKFNPIKNEKFNKVCGSPKYVPPEMFFGEEYGPSIDIWALGVVLFYCSSGYFPFESYQLQKLSYKIMFEEPIYPLGISEDLIDLLKKMLNKEPDDRINWKEIFDHPWVKKGLSQKPKILKKPPIPVKPPNSGLKVPTLSPKEEFQGSIYVTHRSQAAIKRDLTSSLDVINGIETTTRRKQRRMSKLNESMDAITTVVHVMNSHLYESLPIRQSGQD